MQLLLLIAFYKMCIRSTKQHLGASSSTYISHTASIAASSISRARWRRSCRCGRRRRRRCRGSGCGGPRRWWSPCGSPPKAAPLASSRGSCCGCTGSSSWTHANDIIKADQRTAGTINYGCLLNFFIKIMDVYNFLLKASIVKLYYLLSALCVQKVPLQSRHSSICCWYGNGWDLPCSPVTLIK